MYLSWSVIQTGEIKKEHMAKIKSFFSYGSTNQSISTSRLIDIFNVYNSYSKIFTTRLLGSLSYTKKSILHKFGDYLQKPCKKFRMVNIQDLFLNMIFISTRKKISGIISFPLLSICALQSV